MKEHVFIASFDCLGFECILDVTKHEHDALFSAIKNEQHARLPLPEMILRAKLNPQRSPEIWMFKSDLTLDYLKELAETDTQLLADTIRRVGDNLFQTPKQKSVIV